MVEPRPYTEEEVANMRVSPTWGDVETRRWLATVDALQRRAEQSERILASLPGSPHVLDLAEAARFQMARAEQAEAEVARARDEAKREGVEAVAWGAVYVCANGTRVLLCNEPNAISAERAVVETRVRHLRTMDRGATIEVCALYLAAPEPGGCKSLERGGEEPGAATPGMGGLAPASNPPATSSPAATGRCPKRKKCPTCLSGDPAIRWGYDPYDHAPPCPDPFHDTPKGKAGAGGEGCPKCEGAVNAPRQVAHHFACVHPYHNAPRGEAGGEVGG